MAKGSSSRSGPPPDPHALRRDSDSKEWIDLPADGRQGDPPGWPLSKATTRELLLWEQEWTRPQALMWEINGQEVEVAMFVRSLRQAEAPKAPTNLRTLVLRQMEALGLSIPGLLRNKWRIVEEGSSKPIADPAGSGRPTVKERLRVISGEGA